MGVSIHCLMTRFGSLLTTRAAKSESNVHAPAGPPPTAGFKKRKPAGSPLTQPASQSTPSTRSVGALATTLGVEPRDLTPPEEVAALRRVLKAASEPRAESRSPQV